MNGTSGQLRVAINSTALIRPLTGIGQYTWNLGRALRLHPEFVFRYFYGISWSSEMEQRDIPRIGTLRKWFKQLVPNPYEVSRVMQDGLFTAGSSGFKPHVYHEPNYLPFRFDGPTVITVHDLSWIRFPEMHPNARVRIMNKLLPPAIERAAHLLTDSEFSRSEIIETFGVAPTRITTTLLGVSDEYRPRTASDCAAVLETYGLEHGSYVLAVGTLEPRKNLDLVLKAYSVLPDAIRCRWPLVIVGMRGWKIDRTTTDIDSLKARGIVRSPGFVANEDLPFIYAGARVLVYPSVYEGFGLPVAEAMASGVPVIVSDRASLPEVAGGAGLLVDPRDSDSVAAGVERLCEDDAEWERLSNLGLVRASELTWERCAAQTAKVYLQVAGRR